MNLPVERTQLAGEAAHLLHHLRNRHAVIGNLVLEKILIAQSLHGLVAQRNKVREALLESPAHLLRRIPGGQANLLVILLLENPIDLVGGHRLAIDLEIKAKESLCLRGIRLDTRLHKPGPGLRVSRRRVEDRLELTHLQVV